jgi:hypothetical protein
MRVAIIQSSYIPWRGYFDIINDVDRFVFLDDVQYTTRDWRSRNRIKTAAGAQWLSIPAGSDVRRTIDEVILEDHRWQAEHWARIVHAYSRAPFFAMHAPAIEAMYLGTQWRSLSAMNQAMTITIARNILGLSTEFTNARDFDAQGQKLDRLVDLAAKAGATSYLSGPSARSYIVPERFEERGIALLYKDYAGYPEYRQAYPPFVPEVSVLDLLFNVGPAAADHIWGWRKRS